MYLSSKDQDYILQKFPNFELCYEKNVHNKVFKDVVLAIPKGKKYFAWFTTHRGEPCCLFLEKHSKQKRILSLQHKYCSFDETLSLGSIVYGTVIRIKHQEFFVTEDIYYYKNKFVGNLNFKNKTQYLKDFFNHLNMISYGKQFIVFSACIMAPNYKELMSMVSEINYPLYCIQHRSLYNIEPYVNTAIKQEKENIIATFKVVAENQNDIYSLYCFENGEKLYDTAYVSNYKTSVFLNSLFRNIKENVDLDALEESDTEEEFENVDQDKYVLHKTFFMDCKYVRKFKKWEPIRISKQRKLISFRELKNI